MDLISERPSYQTYRAEENPFKWVGIDLTHSCNMACHNCYSPNRTVAGPVLDETLKFIAKLPRRTEIRLMGGEPTLSPDIFEIISCGRKFGHRVVLITNGLKLEDQSYVRRLKEAGLQHVCLSMNGADSDELYFQIDNLRCASRKLAAFSNCLEEGMHLNLSAILIKDINMDVPDRLRSLTKNISGRVTFRFRNVGLLGRFLQMRQLGFEELIESVMETFEVNSCDRALFLEKGIVNRRVEFPVKLMGHRHSWVKLTDWSGAHKEIALPDHFRRGRMTSNFQVASFTEHMKANGY